MFLDCSNIFRISFCCSIIECAFGGSEMKGLKVGEHQDTRLTFGKHKGEILADIDTNYLMWLFDQDWFETDHPHTYKQVKIELKFRGAIE